MRFHHRYTLRACLSLNNQESGLVEPASTMYIPSRFIKEQYLWSRDELTSNGKPSFLPAGDALANGCANNSVGLILQSECREKLVNTTPSLMTWDCAWMYQTMGQLDVL